MSTYLADKAENLSVDAPYRTLMVNGHDDIMVPTVNSFILQQKNSGVGRNSRHVCLNLASSSPRKVSQRHRSARSGKPATAATKKSSPHYTRPLSPYVPY